MRDLNQLIDFLVSFLPLYKIYNYCICDILNRMQNQKLILFSEMQLLQNLIDQKIELDFLDEIIETNNYELFAIKLNTLKD